MTRDLHRSRRLIVVAAVVLGCSGSATAQVAGQATTVSLADVAARVPIDEVVYVTDGRGVTAKGRLATVTADAVQMRVGAELRTVAAADIGRIQWQQADSPLTGILIGAGAGAIPGIYWLIADPNECTGLCPEDYVAIGVGAAVGGLIDRAIRKKVTVYEPGGSGRAGRIAIQPFANRGRRGVQLAVRF